MDVNIFRMRRMALILLYLSIPMLFLVIKSIIFPIIGGVFLIIFLYVSIIFWRCPVCSKGLPTRHSSVDRAKYCPHCGKSLGQLRHLYKRDINIIVIIGLIIVIIFVSICGMYIYKEKEKEKNIDEMENHTLLILEQNEETKEYLGENLTVLMGPVNFSIPKAKSYYYIMTVRGTRNEATIRIKVDDKYKITSIELGRGENEQSTVIKLN